MSAARSERYAVTGATGLIGRALCAELRAAGHEVVALNRSRFDLRSARQRAALASTPDLEGCAAWFHLAASLDWLGHPDQHELNVAATADLCRVAEAHGARRFVFASSIEASGVAAPEHDRSVGEVGELSPYGRSKLEAEQRLRETAHAIELRIARIGIVTGGEDRWHAGLRDVIERGDDDARLLDVLSDVIVPPVPLATVVTGLRVLAATSGATCQHLIGDCVRLGDVLDRIDSERPRATPKARWQRRLDARLRADLEAGRAGVVTYHGWPDPERSSRRLAGPVDEELRAIPS